MKTLGQTLREARALVPFTLRQVEDITGISNAYLSQLENDKIAKPSANVLSKLSEVYNTPFETLLKSANIIENRNRTVPPLLKDLALRAKNLSPEEEEELLKYLTYLRSKK